MHWRNPERMPGTIGIMVSEKEGDPPFANLQLFRRLCMMGEKLGIPVFVFTPERIDWQGRQTEGFRYSVDHDSWTPASYRLPRLVYDRFFADNRNQTAAYRRTLTKLRETKGVQLLGGALGNKWAVRQWLMRSPELASRLPHTAVLRKPGSLLEWLDSEDAVFLKPLAGKQGKGTFYVGRGTGGSFEVHGRNSRNEPVQLELFNADALLKWVSGIISRRTYLIQPFLSLHTAKHQAFDVRALVQKNGAGKWQLTGTAIREGKPGSFTSNLHGGGTAKPVLPYLQEQFGVNRASALIAKIERLSAKIPPALESCCGRLVELGIDFGIDRKGNIWILEVNSKPGRASFSILPDKSKRFESVYNPILYARYILARAFEGGS